MSSVLAAFLLCSVSVSRFFSDGMMLQRDRPVPVWGTASHGERVVASFGGKSVSAKADAKGVSIRSSDPCVDNDILYKNKINPSEIPVRIIKGQGTGEKKESISTSVGAIVSTGSRKGLIKTLLLCDKVMNIRKTNLIVKIVSMIIGMVVTGILLASGNNVSSLIPAAYQLFWTLPIFIVSKIYI